MRPKIVIAYDATAAATDGLVLGRLLGDLRDADLSVARVLPDTDSTDVAERAMQYVGLAIAVVLDALIVRRVLLPAAVHLLGRRSWWPTAPHPIQPTAPGGAS